MSKTTQNPESIVIETGKPVPLQSAGSGAGPTNAEGALMMAAIEFAWQWGRDQTAHPKMFWLERHLETWGTLARAALAYSESLKPPNAPISEPGATTKE